MVPTLDIEERRKRILDARKPKTMDNILRKRTTSGESGAERRLKLKLGKHMNSGLKIKDTALEDK